MDLVIPKCNVRGIPCIQTTGVNVTTANVVFSFAPHRFVNEYFRGIIAIKINHAIPSGTTTTFPIQFTTTNVDNSTINVKLLGGTDATVDTWGGLGIILCFYDRDTNTLQQLTGNVAS